jgi:hypothetical protein
MVQRRGRDLDSDRTTAGLPLQGNPVTRNGYIGMSDPISESTDPGEPTEDDEDAPDSGGPASQSSPASGKASVWLMGGVIGLALGVGAGLLVGQKLWRGKANPTADCPTASTSSNVAPLLAGPAQSALAISLGTLPTKASLEGTWNPRVHMDARDVALTTGKTARLVVSTPPSGNNQVLAVVAKAAGIKLTETLDVEIAAQEKPLTKWTLRPEWSLLAVPLPAEATSGGPLTLDITLPTWAAQADKEAAGPAIALDEMHVGEPTESARVDLRTSEGRAALLEGFYGVEGPGCDEPWAWSEGLRSTVGVLLDPLSGGYKLKLHAAALDSLAPLEIDVRINDKQVGPIEIGGLGEHTLDVPDGILATGANIMELRYPRSARPSEVAPGSKDDRDLAIRLYALGLVPTAR